MIRWTRKTGALTSVDGRFLIRPDYYGTTRAQGYTLMDSKGTPESSANTIRQAKDEAEQRIAAERTNGGGR